MNSIKVDEGNMIEERGWIEEKIGELRWKIEDEKDNPEPEQIRHQEP